MTKPANSTELQNQKATTLDLFTGDVESARLKDVVLLNLLNDQSEHAVDGVTSFTVHDMGKNGSEDTKSDGTEQNDLAGGATPTTLTIDQFKTVPGYFYYVLGEQSRLSYEKQFLASAPAEALLLVEKAAMVALRAIGNNAGHYAQLSGTDSNGTANSVPTVGDYKKAIKKLVKEMGFKKSDLRSIGDEIMEGELPNMFNLYNGDSSSALGDLAKVEGYIGKVLGIPHFTVPDCQEAELAVFHRTAVAWAIRTRARLVFESQGSKNRDYYGINISYGVVARQDNRAFIFQSGAAWAAAA